MTDTTDEKIDVARRVHVAMVKAASGMAAIGIGREQLANAAMWTAVDIAATVMTPPQIIEWLREMADTAERGLTDGIALPDYLN
jgi:hypothetical protein